MAATTSLQLFVVSQGSSGDLARFREHARHDVQIRATDDPMVARDWVTAPEATAWVVDASIGEAAVADLYARLDDVSPSTPFIYVAPPRPILSVFGARLPDLVVAAPLDEAMVIERLYDLLGWSPLLDSVADAFAATSLQTLDASFLPGCEVVDVRFRGTPVPPSPVNAIIPFCGPSISGRLSVSATMPSLQRIHARLLPAAATATARGVEDLAGEISNQLLGALKRVIGAGELEFAIGVPMMFTSSTCPVRYRARRGSTLIRVRDAAGTSELAVDLALDAIRPGYDLQSVEEPCETGELAFL
jgi:hypothetical protein